MSTYPIKVAGFLGTIYKKDISGIEFNAVNLGDRVAFDVSNLPFDAGYVPGTCSIGKEYTNKPLLTDAQECPAQDVHCVPSPTNEALPLPQCFSKTWDSVIAFFHFANPTHPYPATGHFEVPYNDFAWGTDNTAFQTDGLNKQYYMEIIAYANGGLNQQRVKFLFDYITPVAPFNVCGFAATEPATPATPATPTEPAKGQGKPPKK